MRMIMLMLMMMMMTIVMMMMMPGDRDSIREAHCLLIHEIDFPISCTAMSSRQDDDDDDDDDDDYDDDNDDDNMNQDDDDADAWSQIDWTSLSAPPLQCHHHDSDDNANAGDYNANLYIHYGIFTHTFTCQ